jgi:octaprenyl-diphosphate synthase
LPFIYTLNNFYRKTRREIIYIVKNKNRDKAKVDWVIAKVNEAGGIEYAKRKMDEYKKEALDILYTFPESPIRKGLEDLVLYVTDRSY